MVEKYAEGCVPLSAGDDIYDELKEYFDKYDVAIEKFDIKEACDVVMRVIDYGNKYLDDKKPWILAKEGKDEELKEVLYRSLDLLRSVCMLIAPIIPATCRKIIDQLGVEVSEDFSTFGELKVGGRVKKADALFPRLEE
ncbi:MAG: class I tRNA ligase family protein, partial [Candidatus Heimdallarchaeota archaeon]|nr:class I tRNA ligase family protein [Candidatus Heimdallarchaeota archaeon]